ncbi:tail fiber domain-containing protein [bacterium]|nr:tail fiber domain-containing protein [bacterium]
MKSIDKKTGYTLAEIMIVLLVLTIIFAAFAPLITKRRTASTRSKYAVWNPAATWDTNGNAYYDVGDSNSDATAYFGVTPESEADISTNFKPNAKVVIRSLNKVGGSNVQRQIQFRYGGAGLTSGTPNSSFAGSMLLDGRNILIGGKYDSVNYYADQAYLAKDNIAFGYNAMNNLRSGVNTLAAPAIGNIAIGYQAGRGITMSSNYSTYVGYMAGNYGVNQTFIGAYSGQYVTTGSNTAIGYKAGQGATTGASGTYNTFIGADTGKNFTTGSRNLGIGYDALGSLTTGNYNVAVGYNALGRLTTGSHNVAIGYNACSYVTTGSYKTCIGYNSGPKSGTTSDKLFKAVQGGDGARGDSVERTYIGSTPKGDYGGDAVLEIHNVNSTNAFLSPRGRGAGAPSVTSNVTTVINGNLIVRGKLFLTSGSELLVLTNKNVKAMTSLEWFQSDIPRALGVPGGRGFSGQANYGFSSDINYPTLLSDRRLKNITSKSTAGIEKIKQLKVYNYNFKNDKNKLPQVGVIAQDLQKVFPNSVFEGSDGFLRISWDEMFYAVINAIKELDQKIIALVKRATTLETQITKLEQQNSELKLEIAKLSSRVEALKK